MTITISQKLYGLGLLGVSFAAAIGLAGWMGIRQVGRGVQDVGATSSAIRAHMEASNFLDVTRADVSKMFNTTGDAQDTAASEFDDHQKLLRARLAAAVSSTRSPDLIAVLEKESAVTEDYLGKADKIASLRKTPSGAMPLLGGFLQQYQDLRNQMDDSNDKLQTESKRSESDAARVVSRSETAIVSMCLACSLLLFVIAFQIARGINKRLAVITEWLKELASGDLTLRAEDSREDELGEIARWFRDSVDKLRAAIGRVADSANSVTSATADMAVVSRRMSTNAEETTNQANLVTSATEKVSRNLQTVSAATEQMSASLHEIGENVAKAVGVAQEAVTVANDTNRMIAKLGDSSAEIGQVIKVITSIAQQTNLLALNATIEAARAGEAGKGFAVVANEVKELAKQTARATEDIRSKIEAIQADTRGSVKAISTISTIIHQVNDYSSAISTSVDEQSGATGSIAMNISEGAKVSTEIAQNISGVAQAAQSTSTGAHELNSATQKLERLSSELLNLVGQFKYANS